MTRLLRVFATSAAIVALAAGTAAATDISVDPAGIVDVVETATIGNGTANVICNITLTLQLNEDLAKNAVAPMGWVIAGQANNCRSTFGVGNNSITFLVDENGNEWPIDYLSFLGTLPNITELQVNVRNVQVLSRIQTPFGNTACLWQGTAEALFDLPIATTFGWIRGPGSILRLSATLEAGILGCARELPLFGSGRLSTQQRFVLT